MYPHERSLVKRMQGQPFALIGVNSDRDINRAKKAIKDNNLNWRSFWNGPQGTGGPISKHYGVRGWPTIYVIDQNGVIRFKNVRGKDLDKAVDTLIAETSETTRFDFPAEGMGPKYRTWTDATGEHTTKATFEGYKDGKVTLNTEEGREVVLEMAKLSKDDQDWVRSELRARAAERRKAKKGR